MVQKRRAKEVFVWGCSRLSVVAMLALWAEPLAAQDAIKISTVKTTLPARQTVDPVAADIDNDGKFEILVATADGQLAAYSPDSLDQLWIVKLSERAITAPVVGRFASGKSLQAAVGSSDGKIYLVTASNGAPAGSFDAKAPISLALSLVPARTAGGADELVAIDDNGDIHLVAFDGGTGRELALVPNRISTTLATGGTTRASNVGRIGTPATVADLDGDKSPEILVGSSSGVLQSFPVSDTRRREFWYAPQGTNLSTGLAVGEFQRKGSMQVAVGTDSGDLIMLEYQPARTSGSAFVQVDRDTSGDNTGQGRKLSGKGNGWLIGGDFDGDGAVDLAGASQDVVSAFDGVAGLTLFGKPYATTAQPISPLAITNIEGRGVRLLSIDAQDRLMLIDPTGKAETQRLKLDNTFRGSIIAGNLSGAGKLEVVFTDIKAGKLVMVKLELNVPQGTLPMLEPGVGPLRNGMWDATLAQLLTAQRDAVTAEAKRLLAEAKALSESGKTEDAARVAAQALVLTPHDESAQALGSSIGSQKNFVRNIAIALSAVLLLGAGALWWYRRFRKTNAESRARQFAESQQVELAAKAYRDALALDPNNKELVLAYAGLYASATMVPAEAVEILKRARQMQPSNAAHSTALARAWASAGDESDEAFDCYTVALASGAQAAGNVAYCLANIYYKRRDFENALKYYRLAHRDGYTPADLQHKLADIFVATKQFNEKTLATLEAAAAPRANDPTFVEGLCRAYLAARRTDEVSRQAATKLLSLSAENPVALRLAAKCDLKAGQAQSAADFAKRALAVTPLDEEAQLILTQAWQMAGRTDDEAVAIYKATAAKVDDSETGLLRATALLLIDRGLKDDESYGIVKRAVASNPQDGELLEGLTQLAAHRGDAASVQSSGEALLRLGRRGPDLVKQLADAYVALNVSSELAESVFREALKSETDQPDYQAGLAACLVAAGRTDPEAIVSLEKAFARFNTRFDIGMQLTRAYLENQRFDDAQKVTRYLLQHRKDDPELQRLSAQSSLFSNRIDEAIKQYEHLARTNPDDREAAVNLARAYAEKQRTDEAAAAVYQRALDFAPASTNVRVMLARHHAEFGRAAVAAEQLRLARSSDAHAPKLVEAELLGLIAAMPDRVELRWMLADDLIEQGNMRDAVEHLTSIFEIEPSQIKSVLQALDRVLAKDTNNLAGNVQKGILLKAEGRYEESRVYLEKAFRMNANHGNTASELEELYEQMLAENDDVAVRFELGKLNYTRGDYDKAVGHFQKTSQDFRYENESIKMLGLCFVGKGMLEFALQEFRKLVIDDEVKAILYDLAQRYEAKNDVVGAKQVYRMLFAADITYRDVKTKFEMLSGSTSDPLALESSAVMTQLSEKAQRRYTLNRELGRGAMGIVYEAQDNELDELVALKILPDSLSQSPEAIQRFRSEARSARRLAHPNIVRIHDIGEEMGRKYISMEFVRGNDLKRIVKTQGKLSTLESVTIVAQIADALNYAHSMSIVHRDIKPANIMIDEARRVKVSDFGIAKMLESTSETMVGAIMGTPLYMSPEQIMGEPVDRRADIYSLGIMFYELLSGKPPFTGGDLSHQHLNVVPKEVEGITPELNAVLTKCLAKKREDRYDTAGELKSALESLVAAQKI